MFVSNSFEHCCSAVVIAYCGYPQINGVVTVCVDVADIEQVKAEVEKLGPVHLLVNNAGVGKLQHFLHVTPEAYDK